MMKPMKKRIRMIALICGLIIFFLPMPLVDENAIDTSLVGYVQYNKNFESGEPEIEHLTAYDGERILKCLSKYNEYRTILPMRGFGFENVEIYMQVIINSNAQSKVIVLGNDYVNYAAEAYGSLKHGIYNADALRKELLDILNVS